MTIELRCAAKLHGVVDGELGAGVTVEVACDSRFCGAEKGVSVRHRFRLNEDHTLAWDTRRFKSVDPTARERGMTNAPSGIDPALRAP